MSILLFTALHPFLFAYNVKMDGAENKHAGRAMLGPRPSQRRIRCPFERLKTANTPSVSERLAAVSDDEFAVAVRLGDFQNNALARFEQKVRVRFSRTSAPSMKFIKFTHHNHNA